MLQTERMKKVTVFGSKQDMETVIKVLHKKGVYHIEQHEFEDLERGKPLQQGEEIDDALVHAKSLKSEWELEGEGEKELTVKQAIRKVKKTRNKYRELLSESKELERDLDQLREKQQSLEAAEQLGLDTHLLNSIDSLDYVIGKVDNHKGLEEAVEEKTSKYELVTSGKHVGLIAAKEDMEKARKALQSYGFEEIKLPDRKLKEVNKEIKKKEKQLSKTQEELAELKEKNAEDILNSVKVLSEASEKASVPVNFSVSQHTFYAQGYVPAGKYDDLKTHLRRATKGTIDVSAREAEEDEKPPAKMKHTDAVEPFEFLMNLYSLPDYKEYDPTALTFITFPMIFGMMLGDIGYGVVTLIAFLIMKQYITSMKPLINILIASSSWTIVFGVFFGEIFGNEAMFGYHFPRFFSRLHDINSLLIFSVVVGVTHVTIGYILSMYNEYKNHGLKESVYEGGWILLEIAAGLFGLSYLYGTPLYYGFIALIMAVYFIYKSEGVQGVVELPSMFSNILSYARIMAIALASASLAVVVNDFAGPMFAGGIGGIIAGTLLLLVGHFINILLGLFGPFLHSLRLHYVEFFTKFFKGGGKPFKPFGGR